MNHRERILAAIQHQPVDRLPTDMWATPEVWEKLLAHFQVDNRVALYDQLGIDDIFSIFFTEYHRRCFEAGRGLIDITQVTDDFGAQTGLLISPTMFDTFYRVPMQRAIDLAKSFGIIVFHHDDGDLRQLLPTFVEIGIDVLNPIQWRCGDWDLAALKAEYGAQLCFHGGVDNQRTLPFGTPDDVWAEVQHLIATLASDQTGFIIAPCHNLQPNISIENIIALYEAAREFGSSGG